MTPGFLNSPWLYPGCLAICAWAYYAQRRTRRPTAVPDDTRVPCPHCREPVSMAASICPHCQRAVPSKDPQRLLEMRAQGFVLSALAFGICFAALYRLMFDKWPWH